MTASDLRQKYLEFFKSKGHKVIPSAPLVPENDPTALFISAGMQPLVPYLLGQPHPEGQRLVDVQKCLRTDDIDEVGDKTHHTFFEMLGNWSLGDYFKQEAIEWSYEFLTAPEWLNIPKEKLAISVFTGDKDAPFDQQSYDIWLDLGIPEERIAKLPKANNWWGPAGQTGPCGPDTEMFYWTGEGPAPKHFDTDDDHWVEIWNDVFMEYNKKLTDKGVGKYSAGIELDPEDFYFEPLSQKNVDTGMGLERMLAVMNETDDNYQTELFWPIIKKIEEISGEKYEENKRNFRIIADHIRAAVFLLSEDVSASPKDRHGSIVRRLLDGAVQKGWVLGIDAKFLAEISEVVIAKYKGNYPLLEEKREKIKEVLFSVESRLEEIRATPSQAAPPEEIDQLPYMNNEELLIKFKKNYERLFDTPSFEDYNVQNHFTSLPSAYAGTLAFDAKTTEGHPVWYIEESAKNALSDKFKTEDFYKSYYHFLEQHKNISKKAGEKLFKGGLADHSDKVIKYHTATHLLHAALRQVLGNHVRQKGSNITAERLRFDFSQPDKLTEEQIRQVEELINQKIKEDLEVTREEMSKEQALSSGALGFFAEKYGDKVTVYSIGHFSREICGGPHVEHTGLLGNFKITKEESASAGIRRIYATLP